MYSLIVQLERLNAFLCSPKKIGGAYVALSGKMAQNAFFGENELLSFSCTLLSLEHTNSIFIQNGQFLTGNQLFL